MECKRCRGACIKYGFQVNGKQCYRCKNCKLYQQMHYVYNAYFPDIDSNICNLLLNSSGITDISRVLGISKNTVLKRILDQSKVIQKPKLKERQERYAVNELCTKVNGKLCWITYAMNRRTKQVIEFIVGRRTQENLRRVINSVLSLEPKMIYTDQLITYKNLIP